MAKCLNRKNPRRKTEVNYHLARKAKGYFAKPYLIKNKVEKRTRSRNLPV